MLFTDENDILKELNKKNGFVLVIFSSLKCGICTIAEQYLEEVIPEFQDFPSYKCNIDFSPNLVNKYKILSVPMIKLFIDGQVVETLFGLRHKDDIYYTLKNYNKSKNNYT